MARTRLEDSMINKHRIRQAYYHGQRFARYLSIRPQSWDDAYTKVTLGRVIPAMRAIMRLPASPYA